jgi:hypothetical protein
MTVEASTSCSRRVHTRIDRSGIMSLLTISEHLHHQRVARKIAGSNLFVT